MNNVDNIKNILDESDKVISVDIKNGGGNNNLLPFCDSIIDYYTNLDISNINFCINVYDNYSRFIKKESIPFAEVVNDMDFLSLLIKKLIISSRILSNNKSEFEINTVTGLYAVSVNNEVESLNVLSVVVNSIINMEILKLKTENCDHRLSRILFDILRLLRYDNLYKIESEFYNFIFDDLIDSLYVMNAKRILCTLYNLRIYLTNSAYRVRTLQFLIKNKIEILEVYGKNTANNLLGNGTDDNVVNMLLENKEYILSSPINDSVIFNAYKRYDNPNSIKLIELIKDKYNTGNATKHRLNLYRMGANPSDFFERSMFSSDDDFLRSREYIDSLYVRFTSINKAFISNGLVLFLIQHMDNHEIFTIIIEAIVCSNLASYNNVFYMNDDKLNDFSNKVLKYLEDTKISKSCFVKLMRNKKGTIWEHPFSILEFKETEYPNLNRLLKRYILSNDI